MLALNYLVSTTLELFSAIAMLVTYPIVANFDPKTHQDGEIPIILVHGYLHNSSSWLYLRSQLKQQGFHEIYSINLGSPFHSIPEYAEVLQKKIQYIMRRTGCRQVRLVGHSMGGLVSAYYATVMAPPDTVESIITLGSPLHGTKMARIGFGQCTNEMMQNSCFLNDLQERIEKADTIRWLHLGSDTDLIIRPTKSAVLVHPNAKNYIFNRLGHISYLYSPSVVKKITCFYRD